MGVLSNDFAAVDVREDCAILSHPKRQCGGNNLESLKADNNPEEIFQKNTNLESLVRIILAWCRWPDSNRHGIATNGF